MIPPYKDWPKVQEFNYMDSTAKSQSTSSIAASTVRPPVEVTIVTTWPPQPSSCPSCVELSLLLETEIMSIFQPHIHAMKSGVKAKELKNKKALKSSK